MNTTSEQQIPKDKQNEAIDLDETGFEFSNGGGQNKADDDFDRLVGALQDIVLRPEFAQLQKGDKLGDYIEGELKKIVPNLNMKDFTRQFKGRMDEIDPQLFDMFESDKSEEEGEEYKSDIDNLVVAGHSAIIHSQNELDLDETEFEFNNGGGQNKADDEFDQFAGALQDIVLRPEFAQLQKEDKLRDYIEGELKKVMPNLNMKDFTSQMKERMDEIDPQLFDMFESDKLEEEGEYKADVDNLIVTGHSAVLHSQNELVSEEAGFEFTNGGGQNKVDDEFDQLMGALQDIVLRPEFAQQKGDKRGDYIEGELKKVVPNLNMKDFTTQMKGRIDEIDPLLFDVLESGKSEEEEGYKPDIDNLIVTGHSAIIHSQNEKILKKNKEQDASEDKENITQEINMEKKTKIENPGEPPKKLGKVNPFGEQKENIIS